jgi:hypothetical protein
MPLATLYLELPLFGVLAFVFVIAIPAGVVTALKGRWTIYGGEEMERAAVPDRDRRSPRLVALWIVGALAAVLVLGFGTARPSAVFGLSGTALQNSVDSLAGERSCDRQAERVWICAAYDDQFSGTVSYRLDINRLGCWRATRVGSPGEGSRKQMSGCVTALDYVF